MEGSIKIARAGLPEIIEVTHFRDIFGIALTNLVTGGDPASELKKATEQFKPILEKSEKAEPRAMTVARLFAGAAPGAAGATSSSSSRRSPSCWRSSSSLGSSRSS